MRKILRRNVTECFNRTLVELKYDTAVCERAADGGFNRTLVELK